MESGDVTSKGKEEVMAVLVDFLDRHDIFAQQSYDQVASLVAETADRVVDLLEQHPEIKFRDHSLDVVNMESCFRDASHEKIQRDFHEHAARYLGTPAGQETHHAFEDLSLAITQELLQRYRIVKGVILND